MNTSQLNTSSDVTAAMGQKHAKQRLSVTDVDPARLAQANHLRGKLETQADTIEGVCQTFCAEAKQKMEAYKCVTAERAKLDARLTQLTQSIEQKALQLEAETESQKALAAKVEAARLYTQRLAAQYDQVTATMVAEEVVHKTVQARREQRAAEVAKLRGIAQAIQDKFIVESGHLRQLAANERRAALREARECADREAQTRARLAQAAEAATAEREGGVRLAAALGTAREAAGKEREQLRERQRALRDGLARLEVELEKAAADERGLLAQLKELEGIGRAYQALSAQHDAKQTQLARLANKLSGEQAEVNALSGRLAEMEQAAAGAGQRLAEAAQQTAAARQAAETASRELGVVEVLLSDRAAQAAQSELDIEALRSQALARENEIVVERLEQGELDRQLHARQTMLAELIAVSTQVSSALAAADVAQRQASAERDRLAQTLVAKQESLARNSAERAVLCGRLDEMTLEQERAQTARSEQFTLLSTTQASLQASNDDKDLLIAQLTAAQTRRAETSHRKSELSTELSATLARNAELTLRTAALDERQREATAVLAERTAQRNAMDGRLQGLQARYDKIKPERQEVYDQLNSKQSAIEAVAAENGKTAEALNAAEEELKRLDEQISVERSELDAKKATAERAPSVAAALLSLRAEMVQRRLRRAAEEAEVRAAVDRADSDARDAAAALQAADKETGALGAERETAQQRAEQQRSKVAALESALQSANAAERSAAGRRSEELAGATQASASSLQRGQAAREAIARVERDIEREQVECIRLKRQQRNKEACLRKLEKAVEAADGKVAKLEGSSMRDFLQEKSKLQAEAAELEKGIRARRETLAQQQEAKRKEMRYLEKLMETRAVEKQALKQELHIAKKTINSLISDAGQTPKSCLKSPKSPNSPTNKSPAKHVIFNSQSEMKADAQPAQKVPTKRTSTPSGSKKAKRVRGDSATRDVKTPPTSPGRKSPISSPAKGSISPMTNPFKLPQIIEHGDSMDI